MQLGEFQKHMGRLIEQFGKAAYSQARTELIWREVKDFDSLWWERTVDKFLLTCRQAPLMDELASEIGAERERLYKIQKKQHEQDAKDFHSGIYQPDDARTICQYIVKRMKGEVSDEDYANFIKHLEEASKLSPQATPAGTCRDCDNSGIVFTTTGEGLEKYQYVYRCYCRHGQARQENYPIFARGRC